MPALQVLLDGDNCWPDLKEKALSRETGRALPA